jgi:DNA mismatch repair protein MutL
MAIIKIMNPFLANMIAAGEVVERPASIVKELLENAIDADAKEITLAIKNAGRTFIQVVDNGNGMDEQDAELAFVRHATSKISNQHELFKIKTLGFRGEALPSIAAVSKVTLTTSNDGMSGTKLIISGNKIAEKIRISKTKGTSVTVENLFYNTPARLKYLKSDNTEFFNISEIVTKIALANPNISFTFVNDEKTIFKTAGRGELLETIKDIYGLVVAENLMEVNGKNYDYKISGFISNISLTKSNRNSMILVVNKRVVKSLNVQQAIMEGYTNYLFLNRYPMVILHIDVDPSIIDVNVHPAKTEIRFAKSDELNKLIIDTIQSTLKVKLMAPKVNVASKINDEQLRIDFSSANINYLHQDKVKVELEQFLNEENSNNNLFLEPIGQIHGTYIVAQSEDGFYLIDQHAAMERINFEKFALLIDDSTLMVELLTPLIIEIGFAKFNNIKTRIDELKSIGINLEVFGNNAVKIDAVPAWMKDVNLKIYFDDIFEQITNNSKVDIKSLRSYAVASLSCKASLKANHFLTLNEMETLITRLLNCKNPNTCPHGRPTMIFYSRHELERLFKRVG